jgi:hypothetical protein
MVEEDTRLLNFDDQPSTSFPPAMHESSWNEPVPGTPYFTRAKIECMLQQGRTTKHFHLYSTFAPTAQPELWEPEIFVQLAALLSPGS